MNSIGQTEAADGRARPTWFLPAMVLAAAVFIYVPALNFGFVYDDHLAIEENPYLRLGISARQVFTSDVWSLSGQGGRSNYYRPMFFLAYEGVFNVAGAAPWVFHLLNLVFHGATTVLIFLLTRRLWNNSVAWIAALLFALHPVHVEPVAWIAAVSELAYSFFLLLALYFYVERHGNPWKTAAWLASYGMALLWKESAIAFIPIAFLYDVFVLKQLRWRHYAAGVAVTAGYLSLRALALGSLAPVILYTNLSLTTQLLTAVSNAGFYAGKLLLPTNLSAFYPSDFVTHINLRIAGITLLLTLAAWKLRGRALWSVLWIVVALLPVLVVSRVSVTLSDRALYLPSVGFVWLVAGALVRIGRQRAVFLSAALPATIYGSLTLYRLPAWRDDLPLFEQALRQDAGSRAVRFRLASELARRGRFDEGIVYIDEILAQDPRNVEALVSKAGILVNKRDWEGVRSICTTVLGITSRSAYCVLNLGYIDEQEGKLTEAREKFRRAFELNPQLWQALMHQGTTDARLGNFPAAQEALERTVSHYPTAPALNNLGTLYAQRGDMRSAERAFRAAVAVDPTFELARRNLNAVPR